MICDCTGLIQIITDEKHKNMYTKYDKKMNIKKRKVKQNLNDDDYGFWLIWQHNKHDMLEFYFTRVT